MKKLIIILVIMATVFSQTNVVDPECIRNYLKYTEKRNARIDRKLNRKQYAIRNVIFVNTVLTSIGGFFILRNNGYINK